MVVAHEEYAADIEINGKNQKISCCTLAWILTSSLQHAFYFINVQECSIFCFTFNSRVGLVFVSILHRLQHQFPIYFSFRKKSSSWFSVPFDIRYINTYNRCNALAFAINLQYENPEGFKMKLVGVVFITKAEILHFSS